MTGLERVRRCLTGGEADRVPWVPFAGVHAGKLKGFSAREVLTDIDKLEASLLEVNRLYKPDGQPILFDLQIEAEALGATLQWAEDAPPSVVTHPLDGTTDIPARKITKDSGRIPFVLEAMSRMHSSVGGQTALYGLVCGPFVLASHMRGTELFLDMMMNESYVHSLLEWSTGIVETMCRLYIDAGMDVVAVVDPLVSQISPDHFRQFLDGPFSYLFDEIRGRGALSSFFVCGNATKNIEPMCSTHPDSISVDENVSMVDAKAITDRFGIAIGGNIPLTTVMLFGTQQDNMKCAVDLLDSVSHQGLIVSPGCDMPYDVPTENPIAIEQAVHETEQVRTMLSTYTVHEFTFSGELPDYAHLPRPLVEVFTLNSATCAACGYLWRAVQEAKEVFGDAIDIIEYPYTVEENIARCAEMQVSALPSVYINGKLAYSSFIPNREELHERIQSTIEGRT